jgi:CubicO group peptidase (beta-lactamase class C family)
MTMLARLLVTTAALAVSPIAWAQSLPTDQAEQVGMSSQRLQNIGQVFKQEIDQGKLPGAVIMVARDGKLVYSEAVGFQDKEGQTPKPMAKDAIFRIYSMTKPFVSVAAMMLVEDGKIGLTDPLSKYLPEFKTMQVSVARTDPYGKTTHALVAADREATVQDLLRHSAGLAYGEVSANAQVREAYAKAGVFRSDIEYNARDLTPEEEVSNLAKAPLIHQPGTAWEYSLAVDVLGRVVEKAAGKRLEEFLDERLFKPLKMSDSGFHVPQNKMPRLAEPLKIDPASGAPNKLIDVSAPPKNASGGAGAVSTADDYLRFSQMLANGGELDGARVLSPTTIKLMASDHLGPYIRPVVEPGELLLGVKGYTFGLGFAVRKEQGLAGVPGSPGEFMWAGYAGTYFWVDPKEKLVAVLMTQAPGPSRPYYRRLFKQLVYGAITNGPGEPKLN